MGWASKFEDDLEARGDGPVLRRLERLQSIKHLPDKVRKLIDVENETIPPHFLALGEALRTYEQARKRAAKSRDLKDIQAAAEAKQKIVIAWGRCADAQTPKSEEWHIFKEAAQDFKKYL